MFILNALFAGRKWHLVQLKFELLSVVAVERRLVAWLPLGKLSKTAMFGLFVKEKRFLSVHSIP
jgi:hypothetical protein